MIKISLKLPGLNSSRYLLYIVKMFLSYLVVIQLDVVGEQGEGSLL